MESDQGFLEREIPFGFHHFQVPCKNLREGSFYHHHFIMDPRPSQRCVSLKRALGARSFALHQFKSIENGASCAWKSCCKQLNLYICHAKHVTLVRMTKGWHTTFLKPHFRLSPLRQASGPLHKLHTNCLSLHFQSQ